MYSKWQNSCLAIVHVSSVPWKGQRVVDFFFRNTNRTMKSFKVIFYRNNSWAFPDAHCPQVLPLLPEWSGHSMLTWTTDRSLRFCLFSTESCTDFRNDKFKISGHVLFQVVQSMLCTHFRWKGWHCSPVHFIASKPWDAKLLQSSQLAVLWRLQCAASSASSWGREVSGEII